MSDELEPRGKHRELQQDSKQGNTGTVPLKTVDFKKLAAERKAAETEVDSPTTERVPAEKDETEIFDAAALRKHAPHTGQTTAHATGASRFSSTGRKYFSLGETRRNLSAAIEAATHDPYELKEMMARGAEAILYRSVSGAFTFCAKSIRNNWTKLLGGNKVSGGEKLENVKYSTKLRHIRNEFAVSQKLNQDGSMPIVRIHALRKVTRFGVEIGYDLLMEYLEGHDLADKVLTRILPLEDKVRILYQAAQALDYLHRHKVIHLDIKPSNFMLVGGKIKLIDFGVSVFSGYRSNAITGTGGYLSPEQVCKDTIDEKTDLFAFGVAFSVFFGGRPLVQPQEQLMTKQAKQEARFQMESLETPAVHELPALAELPDVAELIRECTIPRRDKRTRSCSAFLMKLKACAEQHSIIL